MTSTRFFRIGGTVSILLACGNAVAAPLGCEGIRAAVDRQLVWKPVARGLDSSVIQIGSEYIADLTIFRYQSKIYRTRPFDMRDIVTARQSQGLYSPPLFSVKELQRNLRQATVIASGGMTRSYSDPVPAGFLRIGNVTVSPVASKDKILDGVVCTSRDGIASILSDGEGAVRRAPALVDQCFGGFQSGPVIMYGGNLTVDEHKLKVARVFFGTAEGDASFVGFSSFASTAGIGCAISAAKIAMKSAIGLQGDTLGGISLGSEFASAVSSNFLGNIDATVASVLIVERRAPEGPRSSVPRSSVGR